MKCSFTASKGCRLAFRGNDLSANPCGAGCNGYPFIPYGRMPQSKTALSGRQNFLEHFTLEMLHISSVTPPACSGKTRFSLALGRGFRSRGHQSNSLIPIVNCSSNEIFPMQECRHTLPQFMSTNDVAVAALLSTYGRPRCRNLFQGRPASLSDSSRVWVAASSILKSSSSKSTGFIR